MYQDEEKKFPWTYEIDQPEQPAKEMPRFEAEPIPQEQPPKKKPSGKAGKVIALALCCSLVGGILGSVGGVLPLFPRKPCGWHIPIFVS